MSELKEETSSTDGPVTEEGAAQSASSNSGEASIPQPSVEDMAAHDYQKLIPVFYKMIEFFSKKKLHALIEALIEYPLERDQHKLAYEDERLAFFYGMQIFDAKFVIMRAVLELTKNQENMLKFKQELDKLSIEGEKKV
jgi:hypothetical protein